MDAEDKNLLWQECRQKGGEAPSPDFKLILLCVELHEIGILCLMSWSCRTMIKMPFHWFKQILDSSGMPENDQEEAKCIWKQKNNKVAAENYQQRKLEVIFGL